MPRSSILPVVGLIFLSMTLIVSGDTAGKFLTAAGFAPFFVAWARFALGAVLAFPFSSFKREELRHFKDWRIWLRAFLIIATISTILSALRTEPIANVFGGFFIGPIVAYFLSALLLGEKITLLRTGLLMVSFGGVLMVVKPIGGINPGMALALLAGCFYGGFLVTTKWLANAYRPRFQVMSHLIIGSVVLLPFAIGPLPAFTPGLIGLILFSAIGSTAGNLILVLVNRTTPANIIAPLVYSQLIAATVLGLLVFGDWPDLLSLVGLAIILTCGLSSLWLSKYDR